MTDSETAPIGNQRKKDKKEKVKLTPAQAFRRELKGYAEALVIAFTIVTFVFTTVGVVGSSMRPNLDGGPPRGNFLQMLFSGDRVFIPKYDTWLRRAGILPVYARGEIVVIREPTNSPTIRTGSPFLQKIPLIKEIPFVQGRPFFIKRLIGLPGDRIRIEEGQVFINGHAIDQAFITESGEINAYPFNFPIIEVEDGEIVSFQGLSQGTSRFGASGPRPVDINNSNVQHYYAGTIAALAPINEDDPENEPFVHEIIVPEGHYFVMGDNRTRTGSVDSRYFGPVPTISVAGKATVILWPPKRKNTQNWRILRPPEAFNDIPNP